MTTTTTQAMTAQGTTQAMTAEGKRALAKAIRGLRGQLIEELGAATERAYRLSLEAKKAQLDEAARAKRARLEGWIEEQARSLPDKGPAKGPDKRREAEQQRLLGEVIKDAAATLLLRLVYLRLLESSGLTATKVVTGGWNSAGYKDFREAAPELVRASADETEGYALLLQLVFDELALELPGLYGPVRMTPLVPVPASALRRVVDALDDAELASVWRDDTTLGWIYQYWNDPEREALDAKLAASKKLENHEIASKTQMFTERYMVEWLLHNSLGQMWLAMCERNGWQPRVKRPTGAAADQPSVLEQLEARRVAWRARREAGPAADDGVALDALMPISPGLEERWKYWVPQPMPADAVAQAPTSVRELRLIDPACGSGHFLVIAFELLFHLYQEEAWLRGEATEPGTGEPKTSETSRDSEDSRDSRDSRDSKTSEARGAGAGEWSARRIVEAILERNLHGLDIDPKAVQIAAAALMLKARQLCRQAEPRVMHLVAPALSLGRLAADDPALRELFAAVQAEAGIPPALTARLVAGLAGADHLGSLLRVDREIEQAIDDFGARLSAAVPTKADQGSLFEGYAPARRKALATGEAKEAVLQRLERFLDHHTRGADLGLRLRGEQLAAGVRFVRMVREDQYDLVIGNPPYQGTSKLADKAYVEKAYPKGKADLYAAFLERGLQLARPGGVSALLTMRNWMFIKQFSALREWLLATHDLRMLGDVDRGAFDEVPNEVLAAVMSVFRRAAPSEAPSVAMQPTPLDDKSYDRERTKRKRAAMLCQVGRFEFVSSTYQKIPESPVLYWWTTERLNRYLSQDLLGDIYPVRQGLITSNNVRFLRHAWEVARKTIWIGLNEEGWKEAKWVPYVTGAEGRAWFEPPDDVVLWRLEGLEVQSAESRGRQASRPQNSAFYFRRGVAFSMIGATFRARAHRYLSIFGDKGSSVFPENSESIRHVVCLLNSSLARDTMTSLNPSVSFQVGDVARIPLLQINDYPTIESFIEKSFSDREGAREPSCEFTRPGRTSWQYAQAWAQLAVDRPDGAPLPPYEPVYVPEPPTDHLSFAVGVALGRFGANGEGILTTPPATALPHGILFLSDASEDDSLAHPAAAPILAAWAQHGAAIDDERTLRSYLQDRFFPDVHRKRYESRPIYFPLSSAKRAFVAYVSIHRWHAGTLHELLAEHLLPAQKRLEGERTDLRAARDGADKKASRAAEKRFGEVAKWLAELADFIALIEQCAEKGPPPPEGTGGPGGKGGKAAAREADARYQPDLDDGVMINSAALWPLLEPQWKDPKKWWKELAAAEGKKDYDWSHLAARYFPTRVDAKCRQDPSLAVAHGCFWKYHPAKAYQWELRLQDELRRDFRLDEEGSDAARAAFEAARPELVEELVTKEHQRRQRKLAKAGGAAAGEDDDPEVQGSLGLEDGEGNETEDDDEEAEA
jgi:hypothetical protein